MRWAEDMPAAGTLHRYAVGATVVRQGDRVSSLSLLLEGRVASSVTSLDGREAIVAILGAGDLVGIECLVDTPDTRAVVTATALEPVRVRSLPVAVARAALARDPALCLHVTAALASHCADGMRAHADTMTLSLDDRLIARIGDLARRTGVGDGDGVLLPRWMTQERLGRCIGATRESVNRALGRLCARGLVRVARGRITVLGPTGQRISA